MINTYKSLQNIGKSFTLNTSSVSHFITNTWIRFRRTTLVLQTWSILVKLLCNNFHHNIVHNDPLLFKYTNLYYKNCYCQRPRLNDRIKLHILNSKWVFYYKKAVFSGSTMYCIFYKSCLKEFERSIFKTPNQIYQETISSLRKCTTMFTRFTLMENVMATEEIVSTHAFANSRMCSMKHVCLRC